MLSGLRPLCGWHHNVGARKGLALLERRQTDGTIHLPACQPAALAAYDFHGVRVKIGSDSEEVVSLFDKAYHFFRDSDVSEPHLEMNLLVKGRGREGTGGSVLYVRVPLHFDAWRFSLLSWWGDTSGGRRFQQNLHKLEAEADAGGMGYQLYRIDEVQDWAGNCFDGLELLFFTFVMHHLPHLCSLHAAVASRDGQGVVFGGPSGSGKSVLSYALARRGFRFLGDEYCLFAPASLQVFPFPRSLKFKPEGMSLFPQLKSMAEPADTINGDRGGHFVDLAKLGFKVTREPARASFLLFVSHEVGALPRLTPLSSPDAIQLLEKNRGLFAHAPREDRSYSRSEAAEALCNNARCYHLLSGDPDKTVDLIDTLID